MSVTNLTVSELNEQMLFIVLPVTVFIAMETIVGFVGNLLILFVYYRFYEQNNFRYFVLSLAIYDFTMSLTTLPGEIYPQFNWYNYRYDWLCKIKSYFNVFTAWGSAFTLLLLAFDRCRKVCCPLSWQLRSTIVLKLCSSGVILSATPVLFLWGEQTYTKHDVGLNVSICEKSGQYANESYPFIYITCVYSVPIGIMMLIILICSVLLARTVFCAMFENEKVMVSSRRNQTLFESELSKTHSSNDLSEIHELSEIHTMTNSTTSFPLAESLNETEHQISTSQPSHTMSKDTTEQRANQSASCVGSIIPAYVIDIDLNSHRSNSVLADRKTVRKKNSKSAGRLQRPIRKTRIILVLTSVYIVTTTLYIALVSLIAGKKKQYIEKSLKY